MTKTIAITSGKGGVGKTTTTANLGTALALMGHKVCLVDADFGLRNLDIPLGLTNRIIFDVIDYLSGKCESIQQVIIKDKQLTQLSLIPGSRTATEQDYEKEQFQQAIEELQTAAIYDYILIDSPAGIEKGFEAAISVASEALIITTPDRASVQDADRVIGLIEKQYQIPYKLILNYYNEAQIKKNYRLSETLIEEQLNIPIVGMIPEDERIIKATNEGKAIALYSHMESGLRFRHIARNLVFNQTKVFRLPPTNHDYRRKTKLFTIFQPTKKQYIRS
ncbi:septum site-determining protein MinD [Alkalihalobacillus pseudalcaliphilus]|uniref:septum site-determining protein MinD n=1 Tax=Alkalihalobacillus pseudalcaliphilus TaxID=79884 RepID=UPI00064DBCC4|nr:septum site-determining protein MinD [Alkalihalobacillus pseudalcaliphilus]KMK75478.1 hypothetical protein AB990_09245 [Alkalihalobacillus pseudalcaliphilus]